MEKQQLIRGIEDELHRTGRRYVINLELLDVNSLRELNRFLRNLRYDKLSAVKRAQLNPWRRGFL